MIFFCFFALLALVAPAVAQGVTAKISPTGANPPTCTGSYSGQFEITIDNAIFERDAALAPRSCSDPGSLVVSLSNGVLTDSSGRTGYIASNYQFQFDNPPQAGAIYTAGFAVCSNGSLVLGSSAVWYSCLSGSFSNLYDRNWAAQCTPVDLVQIQCGSSSSGQAGQNGDGQVVGTSIIQTTIISAISDGQPQVITTEIPIPLCQISDGQAQVHTTPCASVSAVPTTTGAPVSQISDGQVQATSAKPATPSPAKSGSTPTTTSPAAGGNGGSGSSTSSSVTSASSSSAKTTSFANTTFSTAASSSSSPTSKTATSDAGMTIDWGMIVTYLTGIVAVAVIMQ